MELVNPRSRDSKKDVPPSRMEAVSYHFDQLVCRKSVGDEG